MIHLSHSLHSLMHRIRNTVAAFLNCVYVSILAAAAALHHTVLSLQLLLSHSHTHTQRERERERPDGIITMKTHPRKLKTTPRPLFSCGFFGHCTHSVLSPTTSNPPPPHPPQPPDSDSSSSSNTSQSFTQWKFPIPNSPNFSLQPFPPLESPIPNDFRPNPPSESDNVNNSGTNLAPERTNSPPPPVPAPATVISTDLQELFHVAEVQISSGTDSGRFRAIQGLERSLLTNPAAVDGGDAAVPEAVMRGVVGHLEERSRAKSATKVLLALCLAEGNRRVAVEAGAAGRVVEALPELEGAAAERALAALELLCTVAEGAEEVRAHALAVPVLVGAMGRMAGRGKEYAMSILAVIYGGGGGGEWLAPAEEVARAVELALQGDCSARGRRKGAQLLRTLQESGRPDSSLDDQ